MMLRVDSKARERIGYVTMEGINHFLKPAFTSIISLLVIRFSGEEIWGEFVPYLVTIELLLSYLNWGQKPYLTKSFSMESYNISNAWYTAFISRLVLFVPIAFLVLLLPLSTKEIGLCLIWIVLRYFTYSLESVIQFTRKYKTSIMAETSSLIVGVVMILWTQNITVFYLLLVMSLSMLVKSVVLFKLVPKGAVYIPSYHDAQLFLRKAFPFFLLALLGLFQSRVDLYIVTLKMPSSEIAFYHVLSSFLIILQTGSLIILGPFQKNIYRMNTNSIKRIKKKFFFLGILFSSLGAIVVFALLEWLYLFEFNLILLPLIFLYTLPSFWYMIESHILVKHHKEILLSYTSLGSIIVGAVITLSLIQQFGIEGALIGGISSRVIFSVLISILYRRMKLA